MGVDRRCTLVLMFRCLGFEARSITLAFAAALELCHGLARRLELFRPGEGRIGSAQGCELRGVDHQ